MLTEAQLAEQVAAVICTCTEFSHSMVDDHQHSCRRLTDHTGMHRCPLCSSRWLGPADGQRSR